MTRDVHDLESIGYVEVETIFLHDRPLDSDVFTETINFLQARAYDAVARQLREGLAGTLGISDEILSSASAYEEANPEIILLVEGVQDGTSKIKTVLASAAAFLSLAGSGVGSAGDVAVSAAGSVAGKVAINLTAKVIGDAIKSTETYQTVQAKANELTQEFEKFLIEEIEKASDEFKKGHIFAVQSQGKVYVLVVFPGLDHGIRIVPPPELPR